MIKEHADKFDLNDCVMMNFIKQIDANKQVSASDVSIALNALLENTNISPSAEEIDKQYSDLNKMDDLAKENFWIAFGAIDDKNQL